MITSAFEIGEQMALRSLCFILYKPLWEKYQQTDIDLNFSNWISIKYLNDNGTEYGEEINTIPNDKGGLYLFYVKCKIITGITEYPLYIGRAQYTENQNLRKRVKEYFSRFSRNDERPKVTKMFKYWSSDLHLAYLPLEENESIIDLERVIINSTLLPINDEIPEKETRQAVKAFNL